MSMRWYIVHAYSNFEKKVSESIREQAKQRGLEDLFEQVLVPTEKITEVRRGRKVDAERADSRLWRFDCRRRRLRQAGGKQRSRGRNKQQRQSHGRPPEVAFRGSKQWPHDSPAMRGKSTKPPESTQMTRLPATKPRQINRIPLGNANGRLDHDPGRYRCAEIAPEPARQ